MDFPSSRVGQISFAVAGLQDSVESAISNAIDGRGQNLRFANAYCVGLAARDEDYKSVLTSSGLNFADGWPVAWLIRKRFGTVGPLEAFRVRGPSFFEEVIDKGRAAGLRHCMVGSTDQTLELLDAWARNTHPGAEIIGSYAPPFAPVTDQLIDGISERIEAWNPQIVWLGLGTPKQDIVAQQLSVRHPNLTIASVGAAFDFKAGVVSEAPSWVQRAGLEWIYRFASEPRRLWRRYTVGNLQFLAAVLAEKRSSNRLAARVE